MNASSLFFNHLVHMFFEIALNCLSENVLLRQHETKSSPEPNHRIKNHDSMGRASMNPPQIEKIWSNSGLKSQI